MTTTDMNSWNIRLAEWSIPTPELFVIKIDWIRKWNTILLVLCLVKLKNLFIYILLCLKWIFCGNLSNFPHAKHVVKLKPEFRVCSCWEFTFVFPNFGIFNKILLQCESKHKAGFPATEHTMLIITFFLLLRSLPSIVCNTVVSLASMLPFVQLNAFRFTNSFLCMNRSRFPIVIYYVWHCGLQPISWIYSSSSPVAIFFLSLPLSLILLFVRFGRPTLDEGGFLQTH